MITDYDFFCTTARRSHAEQLDFYWLRTALLIAKPVLIDANGASKACLKTTKLTQYGKESSERCVEMYRKHQRIFRC